MHLFQRLRKTLMFVFAISVTTFGLLEILGIWFPMDRENRRILLLALGLLMNISGVFQIVECVRLSREKRKAKV